MRITSPVLIVAIPRSDGNAKIRPPAESKPLTGLSFIGLDLSPQSANYSQWRPFLPLRVSLFHSAYGQAYMVVLESHTKECSQTHTETRFSTKFKWHIKVIQGHAIYGQHIGTLTIIGILTYRCVKVPKTRRRKLLNRHRRFGPPQCLWLWRPLATEPHECPNESYTARKYRVPGHIRIVVLVSYTFNTTDTRSFHSFAPYSSM